MLHGENWIGTSQGVCSLVNCAVASEWVTNHSSQRVALETHCLWVEDILSFRVRKKMLFCRRSRGVERWPPYTCIPLCWLRKRTTGRQTCFFWQTFSNTIFMYLTYTCYSGQNRNWKWYAWEILHFIIFVSHWGIIQSHTGDNLVDFMAYCYMYTVLYVEIYIYSVCIIIRLVNILIIFFFFQTHLTNCKPDQS